MGGMGTNAPPPTVRRRSSPQILNAYGLREYPRRRISERAIRAWLAKIGCKIPRYALDRVRAQEGLKPDGALDKLHEIESRRLHRKARKIDVGHELPRRSRCQRSFRDGCGLRHPKPRRFNGHCGSAQTRRLVRILSPVGFLQVS